MTRKDQIFEAGQKYLDSMNEFQRYHTYPREAFIDGAKWADENPKPEMVNRQEFIERACDYLQAVMEHDLGYYGAIDFANTFRKVMEE